MSEAELEKFIVNPLIVDQSFEFVIMLFAGMTVMLLYDVFTKIKEKMNPGNGISFMQDILFWLFAALLTASFLYYSSFGRLSFHAFLAFAAGAVLWKRFFCGKII